MAKVAALLKLTRFPLVATAVADSATAYVIALPAGQEIRWPALVLAGALSACFYAAGMVYNDLADMLRDMVLHPERPLPSKRVTADEAHRLAKILLIAAVSGACVFGLVAGLWGLLLAMTIVAYNFLLKHRRVRASVAMATARALNFGLGALAAAHLPPGDIAIPFRATFPWLPMLILAAYVFLLTYLSTLEERAGSHARAVGAVAALWTGVPLAGLLLGPAPWKWTAAVPSLWVLPWAVRAALAPSRERLMQAVRWGVLGIILLDASMTAASGRWREALWVAGLMVPALVLLPFFRRL